MVIPQYKWQEDYLTGRLATSKAFSRNINLDSITPMGVIITILAPTTKS